VGPTCGAHRSAGGGGKGQGGALGRCCAAAAGPRVLLLGWRAGWAAEAHAVRTGGRGRPAQERGRCPFLFPFFKIDFSYFLSFFQQSKSGTSN